MRADSFFLRLGIRIATAGLYFRYRMGTFLLFVFRNLL